MTSTLYALNALLRSYGEGEFKNHPELYVFHDHHWHSRLSDFAAAGDGKHTDKPLIADLPPDHPVAKLLPGHSHRIIGVTPPQTGMFAFDPERYVLTGQVDLEQGNKTYTLPTSLAFARSPGMPRNAELGPHLVADSSGAFYNALSSMHPSGQTQPLTVEHGGVTRQYKLLGMSGDGHSMAGEAVDDPTYRLTLHAPPLTPDSPTWQPFDSKALARMAELNAADPTHVHVALNPIPREDYTWAYGKDGIGTLRAGADGVPTMDTPTTATFDELPAHVLHPTLLHLAMGKGYYETDDVKRGLLAGYKHAITKPAIDALEQAAQHQAADEGRPAMMSGSISRVSTTEAPEAYGRVKAAVENMENAGLIPHGTWQATAAIHEDLKGQAAHSIDDARLYRDSHLAGEPSTAPQSSPDEYAAALADKMRDGQVQLRRKDKTWSLTEGQYWPERARDIENPHEMWHGTDVEGGKAIAETGFKVLPELEANGRAFGDGVYLSRHFEKSAQYPFHEPHGAMLRVAYPGDDMYHLDSPAKVESLIRQIYTAPGAAKYKARLKQIHDQMSPLGYDGMAHEVCPKSAEEVQHLLKAGIKGISYPAAYADNQGVMMTANAPRHALLAGAQALAGYHDVPKPPRNASDLWANPRPSQFQGQEAVWYGDPQELKITAHLKGRKGEFIE